MIALQQSSQYIAKREETESRRIVANARNMKELSAIVDQLQDAGYTVDSLDTLRRSGHRYGSAVPILLKWLPKVSSPQVKESIVRTLSVPWAKSLAAGPLLLEFRKAPDSTNVSLKWAIANALAVVADNGVLEEVCELARDPKHGKSREMLAIALGNIQSPRAVHVLVELLNDEQTAGHALMSLGKLRVANSRSAIERFVNHPKSWVRREAKRALSKLDGTRGKNQQ